MFVAVALALVAVSAASTDFTTQVLLKTKVQDNYDVHKVCRVAKLQKWYGQQYDDNEESSPFQQYHDSTPFGKLQSEKNKWKVNKCCNKYSVYEKKQCLKNVREQLLDTHCDKGLTHVCCQTPQGPQRYFCFNKNPFNTGFNRYEDESEFAFNNQFENTYETVNKYTYLEDAEDDQNEQQYYQNAAWKNAEEAEYLKQQYYQQPWSQVGTYDETDSEDYEQYDNQFESAVPYPFGQRKCVNSNHCRRQMEKATNVAAKQACVKNLRKSGHQTSQTCCQAGALVGAMVSKQHKTVCVPALYKFQTKAQGCGVNHKPSCKQAFVECCKQAKADRQFSGPQFDLENELDVQSVYENTVDEVDRNQFQRFF